MDSIKENLELAKKMEVLEDAKPEEIVETKGKKTRNKKQEIFDKFRTPK